MRLDFNAFMAIGSSVKREVVNIEESKCTRIAVPERTTINKVVSALTGSDAMDVQSIIDSSGVSQSAVYRSVNIMVEKGVAEIVFVPRKNGRGTNYFKLTGADVGNIPEVLRTKISNKIHPNNKTGISGVHFNKHCSKWICTFGRGLTIKFDDFLSAACKRKSLELGVSQ